jgi:radical SAM-linked protein
MPTKILAIDDSKTMRLAIKITFAAEDAKVTAVSKGSEAVARAKQMQADVILVDHKLGEGEPSGLEVVAALKANPATANIPVILLVPAKGGMSEAEIAAAGADNYVGKPFDSQDLIDKVAASLGRGAAKPAAAKPAAAVAPAAAAARKPAATPPAATPPAAPRQRWRLVLARAADAPAQTQRELAEGWEAAIVSAGLPLARTEGPSARPRISFGAPLPVGMAADGELLDLVLTERWPAWRVREALAAVLPGGWRLVDLQDVWLAGPPLAGRVAAADYRIELARVGGTGLTQACADLLAAARIPRERAKGDSVVAYDLRPLLIDVRVAEPGPPTVLMARTRFHPELGTGRPEEVVAALGSRLGRPLEVAVVVRARLLLVDELATSEAD